MKKKWWIQKVLTFLLITTLVFQPVPLSMMQVASVVSSAEETDGKEEDQKKEEEEKKRKEEEERRKKEEEEKKRKEEEEKKRQEEEERKKKEEEEKKRQEEEERKKKEEEEEKKRQEEEEKKRQEEEKKRKEEEEKQRQEEEKKRKEDEAKKLQEEKKRQEEEKKKEETKKKDAAKEAESSDTDTRNNGEKKESADKKDSASKNDRNSQGSKADKQTEQKNSSDDQKKTNDTSAAETGKSTTGTSDKKTDAKSVDVKEEKAEEKTYEIVFKAKDGGSVALSSDPGNKKDKIRQTVKEGKKAKKVKAIADKGYKFKKWTKDGDDYASSKSIKVKAEKAEYIAWFEEDVEETREAQGTGSAPALGVSVKTTEDDSDDAEDAQEQLDEEKSDDEDASDEEAGETETEEKEADETEETETDGKTDEAGTETEADENAGEAETEEPADDKSGDTATEAPVDEKSEDAGTEASADEKSEDAGAETPADEKSGEAGSEAAAEDKSGEAAEQTLVDDAGDTGTETASEEAGSAATEAAAPEKAPALMRNALRGEKGEEAWTVTFVDGDDNTVATKEVTKGSAVGNLPGGESLADEGYEFSHWEVDGSKIGEDYVPESDVTARPVFDKIEYTVSFYESKDATDAIATKKVDVDTSFCLNDIPAVPQKSGSTGSWKYAGGDFGNTVTISENTRVWAEYEQNVFTVKWMVEGKEYLTDTYDAGEPLSLPSEPAVEGKELEGWFVGDTEYKGGEKVTSDLVITAKFKDEYKVRFIVRNGDEEEVLSQYFKTRGETIGAMPQNPFVEGKIFRKWVIDGTDNEVTADTVVDQSFDAIAVFDTIDVYTITAEYYYLNDNGNEIIFDTQIMQVDGTDLPYTIQAPSSTKTDEHEVSGGPIYYPETPSVEVDTDDFDKDKACKVRVKFVAYTATYDFVYLLKDLEGDGYTEIDRKENVEGVLHSNVTPEVKTFEYAVLESADTVEITQKEGQELPVKYTRKDFALTYETNGGSYVKGQTAPYGSKVTLTTTAPTRAGYTFDGWYLDKDLTQAAGSTVELKADTTVYAKWKGAKANYTIVYQFEKYNDTGTATSYVYDNSEAASGTVGSTVKATDSGIPDKTRTGWEKDTAKNSTSSVVIAADGSSVLYVYYKLKEYTLTFNRNDRGWIIKPDGTTTTNTYSFTTKIGQDISDKWPSADSNNRYFVGWQKNGEGTRYITKQLIMNEDLLNNGKNVTYYADWTKNAQQRTVNYYLQNADDDGYTKSEQYSQTYYSDSSSLDPKDINGYTFDHRNDSGNTFNFYYNRNTYKIDYKYLSDNLKTINKVKFDATITGSTYNWKPTAAQCGVDSDYIWKGWYADSGLTTPYTFSTMPASNLVLYGRWDAPEFTVSFELDGGTPEIEDQTVKKYDKAVRPSDPEKEGYTFEGWYGDDGKQYDWNNQITSDTTIYAHWILNPLSYTVHYLRQEDDEPVASDKVVINPNYVIGEEVTEKALIVAGYRPDQGQKSIKLKAVGNEITFYYSDKVETTTYTVHYYIEGTTTSVADSIIDKEVDGDTTSVIELAASVNYTKLYAELPELEGQQFYPEEVEKELVLSADASQNVIVFYYSPFKSKKVTVKFVDMDGKTIHDASSKVMKVGMTYTLSRTPISGWELDKAVEGNSYDGTAAKSSYKITEGGELIFTLFYKKKVTITANSLTKQYDGTALKLPEDIGGQVTVEGLAQGDSLKSVELTYRNNDVDKGRRNVGKATVTPGSAQFEKHDTGYYKIRYISGTLEVTKVNVVVRIDPDRWTGNIYNGTEYKAGFTNAGKTLDDYVYISHEGYKTSYQDEIWNKVKELATHDESTPGLHYYAIAKTDAGDYNYHIDFTPDMLPEDSNYSVNLAVRTGRLQIKPKELTVTTGSDTKAYDGTPLTKDEANLEGLVAADQGKVTVKATGSQTTVGSSKNTYEITWGDVKSGNYTITENFGTLEVTKGKLSITIKDATKTYNGSSQEGYEAPKTVTGTGSDIDTDEYTIKGLGKDQTLTISGYTCSSGKDVGTYTNGSFDEAEISIKDGDKDVTEYYTVTKSAGNLTIKPKKLTVTAQSKEFMYNGTAQSWAHYDVDGLEGDDAITAEVTGSITFPSESPVTNKLDSYKFTKGKADNYEVKTEDGELTMKKAEAAVTITAASQEWTYDGNSHQNKTVKVTKGSLFEGDKLVAEATGSVTNVADTADGNNPVAKGFKIMHGTEDVTENYSITTVAGTLTIKPKEVTVTAQSKEFTYNGTAQSWAHYDVDGLEGDDAITAEVTGSITFPNESPVTNMLESYKFTKGEAKNYKVTTEDGKLTMKKAGAAITITAASQEWTYDGNAHQNTKVKVTGGSLFEGDKLVAEATGKVTNVADTANGNNPIASGYKIMHGKEDVTENYAVTEVAGKLTINPKPVTVKAQSKEFTYNGTAQSWAEYDVAGLVGDDAITAVVKGSITFPSQSPVVNNLVSYDFIEGTPENYEVKKEDGELTMKKAEKGIIITAASQEWTYDGKPHENKAVTVTKGELLQGDELVAEATGSVTNVADTADGNNPVAEGYKIMHGTEDVTENYSITTVAGTLTIKPKEVTVKAQDHAFVYTGEEQTWPEYDVDGLVGDDSITAVVKGSITLPKESPVTNKLDSYKFTKGEAENYKVATADGKLTMTNAEAAITITAASQEWTYDGNAHQNTKVTVTEGSLFEGDKLVAEATGKVTNVADTANGNNPIASGYKIMHDKEDVTANYAVTEVAGKLTINPKPVTVKAQSKEFTYNGTAQSWAEYDVEGLVGDDAITAVVKGSITFPSQSPVVNNLVSYDFIEGTPENYEVKKEDGELTMKKAEKGIIITAASQEWTYDGKTHENDAVTVTKGELLQGDELVAEATGSVTNVADTADGNNPVAKGFKIMHGTEDVTENYSITTVAGTLTIKPKEVTVTAQSKEFTYNGTAQSWAHYDVDGLEGDDAITAEVTGSITFPNESPVTNKLESYKFTKGEAENYKVATADGKLTMKKAGAAITITAASQEWTYDGNAHQNTKVTVTEGSLFEGDKLVAEATGKVTNVADTANGNNPIASGYKIMHGKEDVTENYAITTKAGKLTISQREITVKAKDGSKVYDSTPLKAEDTGYEITGGSLVDGDTEEVTLSGEQTLVGSSPATVAGVVIKKGDTDVTGNYKIKTADGTLTVTDGSGGQPVDDDLVVKKTVDSKKYKLGETVKFTVTATNIYDEARDITLTEIDGVTLEKSEFKGVKPGATVNTTASYVIKEADILKGSFKNTVTAKVGKLTKQASATANTEDKNGHLKVEKVTTSETPEEGYALGDTIEYKITVKNDGNLTFTDITVTDELTGDQWQLASLAPGKSKDYTASYTVTEADVLAGEVLNVATVKGTSPDPDDPEPPVDPGVDPEPTEEKNGHLTVEKVTTSETPEKGYPLGATIEYKITVKNDGNLKITDITVTDKLTGDEWQLESLAPGESKDYAASYTVTEADVLAGEVLNVATAKGTSPDPDKPNVPVTPGEDPEPTEEKNGHLTVEKVTTSETPEKGYPLGATIEYKITVKNDGNLKITDITVTDKLTGDEWQLESLAPGESKDYTASHVVTEADVKAGEVLNVATAKGTSPDPDKPNVPVTPGEDPEPTEEQKGHLTVEKVTTSETPEKGYPLGATIEYKITVKNDGNLKITDITVTDELTGDEWKLDSLEPGESKDYATSYTVTEADVQAGEVLNVATAKGTGPDPDDPTVPVTPGEDPEPTTGKKGHLTVNKVTTSETPKGGYPTGATIEYKITAINDGDYKITDITVTDELTGDEWTIESLEPGESKDFTADYTVTEADVAAGEVVNVATAKGTSTDPEEPDVPVDPGIDPEPTAEGKGHLTVKKTTTSKAPEGGYPVGATIEYKITVVNDGDYTITDITVTDELTGDEWTVKSLAPGESKDFTAEYTVTAADAKAGEVVNVAAAKGTSPDPDEPDVPVKDGKDTEPVEPVKPELAIYDIRYKLNGGTYDGSTEDIVEQYPAGTVISIHEAPERDGYTFDYWKGSAYQPGDKYTVTGDHVFEAQWKESGNGDKPEKDSKDKKDSKDSKKHRSSGSPGTGDNSNAAMWLVILLLAAAGAGGTAIYRKKNRK